MKPRFVSFLPAIVWFIISFILLVIPGPDIPKPPLFKIPFFDKWVHIVMFGLLTFLFSYPFIKIQPVSRLLFFKIALWVLCYGVVMEFVQKYFTAGRQFDLMDMLADGCGSFIAYFFVLYLLRVFLKRGWVRH